MAGQPLILLTPVSIRPESSEYAVIASWPFSDAFVTRLVQDDLPRRFDSGRCQMWTYQDADGHFVGFGTLDISLDCAEFNAGQPHTYIPLLAVNKLNEGRGYGQFIVRHLIAEATLLALEGQAGAELYLDVYATSESAIHIYKKCGFMEVGSTPLFDPLEAGQSYLVMTKRVQVASAGFTWFIKVEDSPPPAAP